MSIWYCLHNSATLHKNNTLNLTLTLTPSLEDRMVKQIHIITIKDIVRYLLLTTILFMKLLHRGTNIE